MLNTMRDAAIMMTLFKTFNLDSTSWKKNLTTFRKSPFQPIPLAIHKLPSQSLPTLVSKDFS